MYVPECNCDELTEYMYVERRHDPHLGKVFFLLRVNARVLRMAEIMFVHAGCARTGVGLSPSIQLSMVYPPEHEILLFQR